MAIVVHCWQFLSLYLFSWLFPLNQSKSGPIHGDDLGIKRLANPTS